MFSPLLGSALFLFLFFLSSSVSVCYAEESHDHEDYDTDCDYFITNFLDNGLPVATGYCTNADQGSGDQNSFMFYCASKEENATIMVKVYDGFDCEGSVEQDVEASLILGAPTVYSDCRYDTDCDVIELDFFIGDDSKCKSEEKEIKFGFPEEVCMWNPSKEWMVVGECHSGHLDAIFFDDSEEHCEGEELEHDHSADDIWGCYEDKQQDSYVWVKEHCGNAATQVYQLAILIALASTAAMF